MRKSAPPEWAIEARAKMSRLCITLRDLDRMIDVGYTLLSNVMTGYSTSRPDIQRKILAKLDELERTSKAG